MSRNITRKSSDASFSQLEPIQAKRNCTLRGDLPALGCFAARGGYDRGRPTSFAIAAKVGAGCRRFLTCGIAPMGDIWRASRAKRVVARSSIGMLREAGTCRRRSSYEYEDLLACGRGEIVGPGNAQLPLPPMLMFDRISEISETGGEYGKGADPRRTRRQAGPLVFRLPFQGRSGDAGLPRARRAVADGRLFSRLDRRRRAAAARLALAN